MVIKLPSYELQNDVVNPVSKEWKGFPLKGVSGNITTFATDYVGVIETPGQIWNYPSDYDNIRKLPILWHSGSFRHYNNLFLSQDDFSATNLHIHDPETCFAKKGTLLRLPKSVILPQSLFYIGGLTDIPSFMLDNKNYFNMKSLFVCQMSSSTFLPGIIGFPIGMGIKMSSEGEWVPDLQNINKYLYGECLIIWHIFNAFSSEQLQAIVDFMEIYLAKFKRAKLVVYTWLNPLYSIPPSISQYELQTKLMSIGAEVNSSTQIGPSQNRIMSDIRNFYGN